MRDCRERGNHFGKLSDEDVKAIKLRLLDGEEYNYVAQIFDVSRQTISAIAHGRAHGMVAPEIKIPPRGGGPLLSEKEVKEIRKLFGQVSLTAIADMYGVSRRCIYDIREGNTWGSI